ncbi:MAG: secreted protein, partial [uncultured bacterium]
MVRKKSRLNLSKKRKKKSLVKSKPFPNPMKKVLALLIIIIFGVLIVVSMVNQRPKEEKETKEFQTGPDATSVPTKKPQVNNQTNNNKKVGISYFVDPNLGNDSNSGLSKNSSFKTIQKALSAANPSDVINLSNGIYFQNVLSVRDGTSDGPITIKGEKGAIIKGSGGPRVIEINHNNIHLEGFTVDGLVGDPNDKKSYRDKLIYVLGKKPY